LPIRVGEPQGQDGPQSREGRIKSNLSERGKQTGHHNPEKEEQRSERKEGGKGKGGGGEEREREGEERRGGGRGGGVGREGGE